MEWMVALQSVASSRLGILYKGDTRAYARVCILVPLRGLCQEKCKSSVLRKATTF